MRCIRCHRPLKNPSESGMGAKCYAKAGKPIPAHDLFGFRPEVFAQELADKAMVEIGSGFAAARRRLGLWSAA